MARTETQKMGSIPLHTLEADVDYATATARTTYGAIGIKVWIYRGKFGEVLEPSERRPPRRPPRRMGSGGPGGPRRGEPRAPGTPTQERPPAPEASEPAPAPATEAQA
jgi:small subunit ribosomal protein S3